MRCKSCSSENQQEFSSEIIIHFSGLMNLDKPAVFAFPKVQVCPKCGFTEFDLPETTLRQLGEGATAPATSTSPTQGWSFDLTRESAADKPLTIKNSFYRQ